MRAKQPEDWFEAEQPLARGLIAELQRLKRRARARWLPVVLVAIALVAGVLYKKSKAVKIKRAGVTMAVTEGSMGDGVLPMPVVELRDYIATVLLSNDALLALIVEEDLFPERARMGDDYAISELRDMFGVNVFRNYFLYEYAADAPRSARIAVGVSGPDADQNWHLVHRLADLIQQGEAKRRLQLSEALASEAGIALARARESADELERQVGQRRAEQLAAEQAGDDGKAAALRVEVDELRAKRLGAQEKIVTYTTLASIDEQASAVDRAGLGMRFEIVEEHRTPEEPGARLYFRAIQAAILFFIFLPLVAIVVGTFDPRIHDREDVERVGLPVLGHLPGFPGDGVGSLRDRGVRGRRVPS